MPRLKIEDDEFNADELDEAEYESGSYERYTGEEPPKDTVLRGYVKSMWWGYTAKDDPMVKVLFIADGNTGAEEEYNGCPIWENYPLIKIAKFKWGPFFQQFGLTARLFKTKMYVAEDDDNIGAPIEKVGTFVPGEESTDAWCRVLTTREKYNGKWQTHVAEWMDDAEDDDEDEEEVETEEEVDVEEEEDEDEEPTPPSARTRRAASGKTSVSPATKSAAPAKTAATRTSAAKTSGTPRTAAKSAAGKPAAKASAPVRGRRGKAAAGYDDDPPF